MNQIEKIDALFAKAAVSRKKWTELQKVYDSKNLQAFHIWKHKRFTIENVDISMFFSVLRDSNTNSKFQVVITNSL